MSLFLFSANGACVRKSFICDGISDCRDNSDENYLLCGKNRTLSEAGAILPPGICGTILTQRISFGTEADFAQYPWMALISHVYGNHLRYLKMRMNLNFICLKLGLGKIGFHCSGSLITENFVLTGDNIIFL